MMLGAVEENLVRGMWWRIHDAHTHTHMHTRAHRTTMVPGAVEEGPARAM